MDVLKAWLYSDNEDLEGSQTIIGLRGALSWCSSNYLEAA